MPRRLLAIAFLLPLVALAGCGRQHVNVEKSVTLEPGRILQPMIVDAPKGDQKILVQVTSDEPINVDVALQGKAEQIMSALEKDKRPASDLVLVSKEKTKGETIVTTIPAGQEYTVFVSGATKKSNVKVSLTSQ